MPNSFETSSATGLAFQGSSDEPGGPLRIALVPEHQIRQLSVSDPRNGFPRYVAVRPRRGDSSGRQTWEALFYPIPDTDVTVTYKYSVIPQPLSEARPYPLGGRQYAELLLQSCLAVAEERETKVAGGPAATKFLTRLAAAIQFDQQPEETEGIWPLDRTETVTRGYLKKLIGVELDFGPHLSSWTHRQSQEVELALQTGLRKFYHPAPLIALGEKYGHLWSFLRPVVNLDLVRARYRYDLPADFALLDSPLSYAPGQTIIYDPVDVVGEHQLRSLLQRSEATARPTMAAVVPKAPSSSGTRYELLVWPVPDQAYQLTYRYQLNPAFVSEDSTLPHGGPAHAQTLIEACLAAAEEQNGKPGMHSKLFVERMIQSVSHDRQASSPATLGYNRDMSDRVQDPILNWHDCGTQTTTYNGRSY